MTRYPVFTSPSPGWVKISIEGMAACRFKQNFDAGDFADRGLDAMSDDELFETMQRLEDESETSVPTSAMGAMCLAKIALVETAIEDRFPGQLLVAVQGLATTSGH